MSNGKASKVLDLDSIKALRFELGQEIKRMLERFEAETSLVVTGIEIRRRHQSDPSWLAGYGNDLDIFEIRVSVAVP